MANLNEQSLLSYLKEELLKTQTQYLTEVEVRDYWMDGTYLNDSSHMNVTNEQVDFFITNCENRMKPLMFRMKWLEGRIDEINVLTNLLA